MASFQKTISAADKIKASGTNKGTEFTTMEIFSSLASSLVVTDGTLSLTIYTQIGANRVATAIQFAMGADVTITPTDPMTVLIEYNAR